MARTFPGIGGDDSTSTSDSTTDTTDTDDSTSESAETTTDDFSAGSIGGYDSNIASDEPDDTSTSTTDDNRDRTTRTFPDIGDDSTDADNGDRSESDTSDSIDPDRIRGDTGDTIDGGGSPGGGQTTRTFPEVGDEEGASADQDLPDTDDDIDPDRIRGATGGGARDLRQTPEEDTSQEIDQRQEPERIPGKQQVGLRRPDSATDVPPSVEQELTADIQQQTERDVRRGEDFVITQRGENTFGAAFTPGFQRQQIERQFETQLDRDITQDDFVLSPTEDGGFTGELTPGFQRELAAEEFEEELDAELTRSDITIEDGQAQLTGQAERELAAQRLDEQFPTVDITAENLQEIESDPQLNPTGTFQTEFGVTEPIAQEIAQTEREREFVAATIEQETGEDVQPSDIEDPSQLLSQIEQGAFDRELTGSQVQDLDVQTDTIQPSPQVGQETVQAPDVEQDIGQIPGAAGSLLVEGVAAPFEAAASGTRQAIKASQAEFGPEFQTVSDVAGDVVEAGEEEVVEPGSEILGDVADLTFGNIRDVTEPGVITTTAADPLADPLGTISGEEVEQQQAELDQELDDFSGEIVTDLFDITRPTEQEIAEPSGFEQTSEALLGGLGSGGLAVSVGAPREAVQLGNLGLEATEFSATAVEEQGPLAGLGTTTSAGIAAGGVIASELAEQAEERPAEFTGEIAGSGIVSGAITPLRFASASIPTRGAATRLPRPTAGSLDVNLPGISSGISRTQQVELGIGTQRAVRGVSEETPNVEVDIPARGGFEFSRPEINLGQAGVDFTSPGLTRPETLNIRGIRLEAPAAARALGFNARGRTLASTAGARPTLGAPSLRNLADEPGLDLAQLGATGTRTVEPGSAFEADIFRATSRDIGEQAAERFRSAEVIQRQARTTQQPEFELETAEEAIGEVRAVPEASVEDVTQALRETEATVFGSAAARAQTGEFRQPRDIDVVVEDETAAREAFEEALEGETATVSDVFDIKTEADVPGRARGGEQIKFGRISEEPRELGGVQFNPATEELVRKSGASAFLREPGAAGTPELDIGPEPRRPGRADVREKDVLDTQALAQELGISGPALTRFERAFDLEPTGQPQPSFTQQVSEFDVGEGLRGFVGDTRAQFDVGQRRTDIDTDVDETVTRRTDTDTTRRTDIESPGGVFTRGNIPIGFAPSPDVTDQQEDRPSPTVQTGGVDTTLPGFPSPGTQPDTDVPSPTTAVEEPGRQVEQPIASGPFGSPTATTGLPSPAVPSPGAEFGTGVSPGAGIPGIRSEPAARPPDPVPRQQPEPEDVDEEERLNLQPEGQQFVNPVASGAAFLFGGQRQRQEQSGDTNPFGFEVF